MRKFKKDLELMKKASSLEYYYDTVDKMNKDEDECIRRQLNMESLPGAFANFNGFIFPKLKKAYNKYKGGKLDNLIENKVIKPRREHRDSRYVTVTRPGRKVEFIGSVSTAVLSGNLYKLFGNDIPHLYYNRLAETHYVFFTLEKTQQSFGGTTGLFPTQRVLDDTLTKPTLYEDEYETLLLEYIQGALDSIDKSFSLVYGGVTPKCKTEKKCGVHKDNKKDLKEYADRFIEVAHKIEKNNNEKTYTREENRKRSMQDQRSLPPFLRIKRRH